MSSPPSFGAVDASNCDREPIHIPGSIQPHGALIALHEPELTVFQVSDNVASFVDRGPGELLGQSLDKLLGVPMAERFRETCVGRESFLDVNPIGLELATRGGVRRLDGVLHRAEGLLILELEPSPERSHDATDTYLHLARAAVRELQIASTLEEQLQTAAELIRGRAGFDRVMVYRFDRDWHGEVIAEAVREDLEPFLGLHYPASDIPTQARELYTRSWLRLIPDVGYTPVPLTPSHNPLSGTPLDLSCSILRSVSPIHLEYLRNMGVAASMSISLMKRGQLWGLIACHHQTPHPVSYELRAFAEFIAQALSWQLTSKLQLGDAERRLSNKRIQSRLIAAMAGTSSLVEGLLRADPQEFLALGRATGGALHHEGALHTVGVVPPESEILAIIERLASTGATDDVFATDVLGELHPPAAGYPAVASGLLAITLSRQNRDCLLWFRPEHAMTVTWGGDPHKAVEQGSLRLSPRKSFSAWKERVHLHSLPFDDADLEAARDLRSAMLAVILRRASELKRLNQELNEAVLARDDFFSVASHELRTPLSTLSLQLHMLLGPAGGEGLPAPQLRSRLEVADRQVKRLNQLIDLLLDVTRIRAGKLELSLEDGIDLGAVIREVAGGMELERQRFHCPLELQLAEGVKGRWDAQRLDQVVANLLSNAFKYGDQQKVTVTLTSERARSGQGVARLEVRDEGIGMTPEAVSRIFQRFERAGVVREYTTGLGLGLWISQQIVLRLGGAIETQSTPKRGSTFIVTLPLAGPVE